MLQLWKTPKAERIQFILTDKKNWSYKDLNDFSKIADRDSNPDISQWQVLLTLFPPQQPRESGDMKYPVSQFHWEMI